jgi:hypothetical protein
MTKDEFIKLVNDKRKANKDKWVTIQEEVDGVPVAIKSFNTWIQLMYTNDGRKHSGPMDCKVSTFNLVLKEVLDSIKK